jgi:hypothetical protein
MMKRKKGRMRCTVAANDFYWGWHEKEKEKRREMSKKKGKKGQVVNTGKNVIKKVNDDVASRGNTILSRENYRKIFS